MATTFFAEPSPFGWYIVDDRTGRRLFGYFYSTKRDAVAKIRAVQPPSRPSLFFYRLKEFAAEGATPGRGNKGSAHTSV